MTYSDYLALQKSKNIQPLSERAFNAMQKAGFNFYIKDFNKA
jgi:hypothetical protein